MEKRSYLRLPLRLTTLIHGEGIAAQFCKTTNIGPNGGCLEVNNQYPPGTDFVVDIYADMTTDAHRTISTRATSIYQDSHNLGIKFPSLIDFYLLIRSASSLAANKRFSQYAPSERGETEYDVVRNEDKIAV